jgi:hypothetical protein
MDEHLDPPQGGHEPDERDIAPLRPRLVVSEERTPLPQVDRALPILNLFPSIVGRGPRGRLRVGLLKTLAGSGTGRWTIRQIQAAVYWLDGHSVTELVEDLYRGDVLAYDRARRIYTMPSATRVAVAIIDALTFPGSSPERLVQWLSAAIELSAQGDPRAAINSFAQAVAILRTDVAELHRLMEDGEIESLLEAAEKFDFDADDMDVLLDRHETLRLEQGGDPQFRELEEEAFRLAAQLHKARADVVMMLTGRADEVMLGGARVDRAEIRDYVAQANQDELAGILDGLALPPAFLPFLPAGEAFEQLVAKSLLERPRPLPIPEPRPIEQLPLSVSPDETELIAGELLALDRERTLRELAVRANWAESAGRHVALLDAYVRDKDQGQLPELHFDGELDWPVGGPVTRVSRVRIKPKERV